MLGPVPVRNHAHTDRTWMRKTDGAKDNFYVPCSPDHCEENHVPAAAAAAALPRATQPHPIAHIRPPLTAAADRGTFPTRRRGLGQPSGLVLAKISLPSNPTLPPSLPPPPYYTESTHTMNTPPPLHPSPRGSPPSMWDAVLPENKTIRRARWGGLMR